MKSPNEPVPDFKFDIMEAHLKNRYDAIKRIPDWWFNLEKLEAGFKVVQMLRDLKFKLHILTRGPKNIPSAWEQKVRWARTHVPDADITITLNKSLVYGRVLVDDWPNYIIPWLNHRPRGLVIMPAQPWNDGFAHPQVIRHVNNDSEVYDALKAQRERA